MGDIVLAGVGGQGLITLGRVVGEALMLGGYDVKIAEVHGLSQRGGAVIVYVRFDRDHVYAPTFSQGEANTLVALEMIEAVRRINFLSKDGLLIANDLILSPPASPITVRREDIVEEFKKLGIKYFIVDATTEANKLGFPAATNTIMLGVLLGLKRIPIPLSLIDKAIENIFDGEKIEINKTAVRAGVKLSKVAPEEFHK